jgi:DNA-binding response OmpR family regulator
MNNPAAPRVFLADDNIDAAELTGQLLEFHGMEVRCVFDGAAAVAQVTAFRPDVVILDIGMPGLDGHATFRAIRALARGRQVPIMALTAYNSAEEARRIRDTGFSAHLVKPCDIALLLATIRNLLKTGDGAHASSRRTDELTAQRIEVALVYQQMLGTADAQDYLSSLGVPEPVARRVLLSDATRVSPWVNEEP